MLTVMQKQWLETRHNNFMASWIGTRLGINVFSGSSSLTPFCSEFTWKKENISRFVSFIDTDGRRWLKFFPTEDK